MSGTVTIRPHRWGLWREVNPPAERLVQIEDWPHDFAEHPDRWGDHTITKQRVERSDFAGCQMCGASELSAVHIRGAA